MVRDSIVLSVQPCAVWFNSLVCRAFAEHSSAVTSHVLNALTRIKDQSETDLGGGNKPQPLKRPRTGDKNQPKFLKSSRAYNSERGRKTDVLASQLEQGLQQPTKMAGARLDTTNA